MSEFKAMKFWIGQDPACSERVQKMLFDMGYAWYSGERYAMEVDRECIHTDRSGRITYDSSVVTMDTFVHNFYGEGINIDWLRTPKQITIELNGKNYIKADVEAALEKLKPVGE